MDVNTQSRAARKMEPAAISELGAVSAQPSLAQGKRTVRSLVVKLLLSLAVLGDVIAVVTGLSLGYWIRFESGWIWFGTEASNVHNIADYRGLIAVGTVFMSVTFVHFNIYELRNLLRYSRTIKNMARSIVFWSLAYLGASLVLYFHPPISRIYVGLSCLTSFGILVLWRYLLAFFLRHERIAKYLRERVLFVGWGPEAQRLAVHIAQDKNHPFTIAGWVPGPRKGFPVAPPPEIRRLGDYLALPSLLRSEHIDTLMLADLNLLPNHIVDIYNQCEKAFVQFKKIPSYFQAFTAYLKLETISGIPILGMSQLPSDRFFNRILKRVVDIVGSIIGLFLSTPIMAVCGALVYWESPGQVFFAQERIGRNGRAFRMFKLRSMRLGAELTDHLNQSTLREDSRLLRVGRFMRRWNLDEVPQFWNVLRGDMSLVGPRPERTVHSEQLSNKIPHYNARYTCKPGITGWAQINGFRGDTDLVERVRYDLFYLENWSMWLDLQIMFQTFYKLKNAY